jgi:hypothetical protein
MDFSREMIITHTSGNINVAIGKTHLSALPRVAGCVLEEVGKDNWYLIYYNDGISVSLSNSVVDTVFLYTKFQDQLRSTFKGSVDILPVNFFKDPDESTFERHLKNTGFEKFWKEYPFSVDMVTPILRARYYSRPDLAYVSFDESVGLPIRPTK